MSRHPRHLPRAGCLVEVTVRTAQGRFLLRPGRELNRIFAGCLGRAQALYPVRLHAVVVVSSHFHVLLSADDSKQMADFMGHLNGNLSKKVGKLHDWSGTMFDRRYSGIPVSDEPAAQEARLRYLLSHGCKENLVLSPRDWPGIHSATALCDGEPIEGTWVNRTAYWQARNRGQDVRPSQFGIDYQINLEPLPCWQHLDSEAWRALVREMVEDIERETLVRHRRAQTAPAGASSVLRRSPRDSSGDVQKSPAPMFHAASKAVRQVLRQAFGLFLVAYRDATERLKSGDKRVPWPADCFPPGLPYVPPAV